MTYNEIINQAIETCVGQDEGNGMYYIEPMWRLICRDQHLVKEDVVYSDKRPSEDEVKEILELYVNKMNVKSDNSRALIDWLYNIALTSVDPAIIDSENELIKNLLEYNKNKQTVDIKMHALNEKEEELEKREEKEKYSNVIPFGVNIAKKK